MLIYTLILEVVRVNIKLNNLNTIEDIDLACKIINGKINKSYKFSNVSPIYKTTNENISKDEYSNLLKNKDRVLSIIGSGDQILNSIFWGSKDIIGVDISRFPKYFLSLKLSSIEVLEKKEYIKYFYGFLERPFQEKYYDKVRENLENNTKLFWDSLYNEYNYDKIYNSQLFYDYNLDYRRATQFNPFLQKDNYNVLKEKINNIDLELFDYDMFKINEIDIGRFDLIILSNIMNYIHGENNNKYSDVMELYKEQYEDFEKYKNYLKKLPLKKDGIAISYNIGFYGKIDKYFSEKEYKIYKVDSDLKLCKLKNEIVVYEKNKKLKKK